MITCNVIVFPGSNCDYDCHYVMQDVMNVHANYVWHKDASMEPCDFVILPGGFSYGDYLRCGAIARFSPIMKEVVAFAKKGRPVIGICNGFQILLEAGLLPGAMLRNKTLRFICDMAYLKTLNFDTPFTREVPRNEILAVPIAHGEGNYYCDEEVLAELTNTNRIVFQYCSRDGEVSDASNPNGSRANIAGIINDKGNVLGMMPHPERASEPILGSTSGAAILQSLITAVS